MFCLDQGVRIPGVRAHSGLEHILPENPNQDWGTAFPGRTVSEYVYRLGNLVPLERRLNKQVGAGSFAQKQPLLKESRFHLAQAVGATAAWTPDTLAARQEDLAELAKVAWRPDFA